MFKKGFTLIEMLVVIAIIGILAALLSGPLMRAKKNADVTACLNNVKQIGGAMFQYTNDTRFVPLIVKLDGDGKQENLEDADEMAQSMGLLFVTGYADDATLFQCPLAGGLANKFSDEEKDADDTNMEHVEGNYDGSMVAYLITPNLAVRNPSNMPILADRAWDEGGGNDASGWTEAHGDVKETAGEWGGSVLMKDNSVRPIRHQNGFVENSAANADKALWQDSVNAALPARQGQIIQ